MGEPDDRELVKRRIAELVADGMRPEFAAKLAARWVAEQRRMEAQLDVAAGDLDQPAAIARFTCWTAPAARDCISVDYCCVRCAHHDDCVIEADIEAQQRREGLLDKVRRDCDVPVPPREETATPAAKTTSGPDSLPEAQNTTGAAPHNPPEDPLHD